MGVTFDTAGPGDDLALRDMARRHEMPGKIRLSYAREPSFFDALAVEGQHNEVIVARDDRTGEIVGLATRSIKTAYLNGRQAPLGYLGGLRLEPSHRRGLALARGFGFLRRRHRDRRTRLYLTTILESNAEARTLLTSRRAGLPDYHDLGRLCCLALGIHRSRRPGGRWIGSVRTARSDDLARVVEFWREHGPERQFFPAYSARDLTSSTGLLRGLAPEDILVAEHRGEILGTVAVWDQRAFRQNVVIGYSPLLGSVRRAYNGLARLAGYPRLPVPGDGLDLAHLSLTCARQNDREVFAALLQEAVELCRGRCSSLVAGLHERDPLLEVLLERRHLAYPSRLYAVTWDEGSEARRELDDRVPYVELGGL